MQEGQEKSILFTNQTDDFCVMCIRESGMCILLYEVRNNERRGKTAASLGSGGSQTPCDPIRTPGKPGTE